MAPHAKRRKLTSAVEEITFDPVARHEFLTGFHKRKMQRIRQAQEYAQKKAREERRLERKKVSTFVLLCTIAPGAFAKINCLIFVVPAGPRRTSRGVPADPRGDSKTYREGRE